MNINCSELATLIGQNDYGNMRDQIMKLWEKYFPDDFQISQILYEAQGGEKLEPKLTEQETIKKLEEKSDINISQKVQKCLKETNVVKMQQMRSDILKQVTKSNLNKEDKKEMKKSIEKLSNTTFGTNQELSATEQYALQNNVKVVKKDNYMRKKIYESKKDNCFNLYIGGKVDGIDSENNLIEVKNRMYKFFNTIRNYEMVQIQSYLFITGLTNAKLVECLKKNKANIKITDVKRDNDFIENVITSHLTKFGLFFENFIEDNDLKMNILGMEDDEDANEIIYQLIYS